jgi:phospholipid/cholesterol/gamma-HCH transport system ATP-binding protein
VSAPDRNPLLQIQGLQKRFGENAVLTGIDLTVPRGALVTILGRSGSGKSVLLKSLAAIITPDTGTVTFDGQLISGTAPRSAREAFRRRCSFLFQSNALFDSLTALENVSLPLEQTTSLSDKEVRDRSMEALHQLELDAHHDRYPSQLSGGMQKRLALARAIVTQPELVLFDEPTAGLDPIRRNAVFTMIARYQRQFGFTALVVTHDVPEALVTSDQVALLEHGVICFQGTPQQFQDSQHPTVKSFRDSKDLLSQTLASLRLGALTPTFDS